MARNVMARTLALATHDGVKSAVGTIDCDRHVLAFDEEANLLQNPGETQPPWEGTRRGIGC